MRFRIGDETTLIWYLTTTLSKFNVIEITLVLMDIVEKGTKLAESIKGQVILKGYFGVFNFFQKTNENKLHSRKNEFVCSFFGRIQDTIICFSRLSDL